MEESPRESLIRGFLIRGRHAETLEAADIEKIKTITERGCGGIGGMECSECPIYDRQCTAPGGSPSVIECGVVATELLKIYQDQQVGTTEHETRAIIYSESVLSTFKLPPRAREQLRVLLVDSWMAGKKGRN